MVPTVESRVDVRDLSLETSRAFRGSVPCARCVQQLVSLVVLKDQGIQRLLVDLPPRKHQKSIPRFVAAGRGDSLIEKAGPPKGVSGPPSLGGKYGGRDGIPCRVDAK